MFANKIAYLLNDRNHAIDQSLNKQQTNRKRHSLSETTTILKRSTNKQFKTHRRIANDSIQIGAQCRRQLSTTAATTRQTTNQTQNTKPETH
jgi:hypothetical protein